MVAGRAVMSVCAGRDGADVGGHHKTEKSCLGTALGIDHRVEQEKKIVADWKRCIAALKKKHAEEKKEAAKEERTEPVEPPTETQSEQE